MRTISWKHPLIALFVAGTIVAACSDDTSAPAPVEAGPEGGGKTCGNKKKDTGEDCDPPGTSTTTCSTATMGMKTSGTVTCSSTCKFDVSKCTGGGGTGGGGGGGTGGTGNAGTGGGPGGRRGMTDGGPDAGDGGGKDAGKLDSGSGGSTPDATPPAKNAAKD